MYDLIIIGSGPAGLTSAIYAARYTLKTLLIGEILGGVLSQNYLIENYPGVPNIRAFELAQKMLEQARGFGVEFKNTTVTEINKIRASLSIPREGSELSKIKDQRSKIETGGFEIACQADKCLAKAIIIATGTERRKLGVPGEAELTGSGVSYCSTCDGNFFKGKTVGVVGGGDAAIRSALDLSNIAAKVYLIHRREEFKAKPEFVQMARAKPNVEFILNANVLKCLSSPIGPVGPISPTDRLAAVKLDHEFNGSTILPLDGLFIEIGGIPSTKFAQQLGLATDDQGYIKVSENMETSLPGVFAAGDVTTGSGGMKQIVCATSEGALAARSAYRYLSTN